MRLANTPLGSFGGFIENQINIQATLHFTLKKVFLYHLQRRYKEDVIITI